MKKKMGSKGFEQQRSDGKRGKNKLGRGKARRANRAREEFL
jgi:hypothetical protein